ncbi:aminotransferase class V-fold PLP-dependent enzyme [Staphylococcus saccharolyticus]|uniref:aminotransferase class V-fold PLP-dependent enzyme n=1 Tax=Staphylococcus saccharolyticus TaxID=33028 RepID=UPI001932BAE4|nr:aminotransferase class V-fold PLP-dependent enzyme [Staphylococcus saccharolyticus]MBL7639821.1 aminotransferase class V-fold PLP-dependent enzyme [Staphylococcus saccharolyticus]
MNKPIIKNLTRLKNHGAISMHVPGHKNMTIGNLKKINLALDMTEITGLDDMHHPEEIILESMEKFKKYDDYDVYFLVNGTTSGILTVIQAFSEGNSKYLISRNVHKSVFHGLDLTKQQAKITSMQVSRYTHQYVEPLLNNDFDEEFKLGICTYPNYYGETFEVDKWIETLHDRNIPVLVDEAHGAHFDLKGFPRSSMKYNADYVVQSYHKTLPALTMGSVLFIHKEAPRKDQVIEYLTYFQTSSPSYLIMSSLELAQEFFEEFKSNIFFEKRSKLIETLLKKGFNLHEPADPLKIVINYDGFEGYEVQEWFENEDIYIELADEFQILLVLPLWHKNDIYPFKVLIEKIENMIIPERKKINSKVSPLMTKSSDYSASYFQKIKEVSIEDAEGEILAQHIVPYPPGIPILFKGEVVTRHMIELFKDYASKGLKVEGLSNKKIIVKDE